MAIKLSKCIQPEHTHNKKADLVKTIETIVSSLEKHSDEEIYKILESVMYIMDYDLIKKDRQGSRALGAINSKYKR